MAEFVYNAVDDQGRTVSGSVEADDRTSALARLRTMGMYPTDVSAGIANAAEAAPSAGGGWRRGISNADLTVFTRQLASLFAAGLNLARCLDTLIQHAENPNLVALLSQVQQAVSGGSSLHEALREHPKQFSDLYVSLVEAGETSGQLGSVLDRLADTMERQQEYRARVRTAMAYPILLMVAGAGVMIFILTFLVPRFEVIFAALDQELPAPTKVLMGISTGFKEYWWAILIGIVAVLAVFRLVRSSEEGALALDRLKMRIWLIGRLTHREAIAQFCRTMATLVGGGVAILDAFDIAERAVSNRVLRQAIQQVRAAVKGGENLSTPMARSPVFPALMVNMVAVGEETGKLVEMLNRVADSYDAEVQSRLQQIVSLVEPLVILVMGVVVGSIVISLLLPVMEMSTAF